MEWLPRSGNKSAVCLDPRLRRISRLMRAVVITSYGGVEGIGVQEVDTPPAPTADRVRVRVHAAGLNRADILQRRGHYPAPPGYPPNIPGMEFAGEGESPRKSNKSSLRRVAAT